MKYTREEITKIWQELVPGYPGPFKGTPVEHLKSTDYKEGSLYCNVCNRWVERLVRVNGKWACIHCNNAWVGQGRGKVAFVYRIINDLYAYFGELNSEDLFNSDKLKGFVNFINLERVLSEYTLFLSFIRILLSREIGAVSVLDFLHKAKSDIDRLNHKEQPVAPKIGLPTQ